MAWERTRLKVPNEQTNAKTRKMSGGDAAGMNSTPVYSVSTGRKTRQVVQQVSSEMKCR